MVKKEKSQPTDKTQKSGSTDKKQRSREKKQTHLTGSKCLQLAGEPDEDKSYNEKNKHLPTVNVCNPSIETEGTLEDGSKPILVPITIVPANFPEHYHNNHEGISEDQGSEPDVTAACLYTEEMITIYKKDDTSDSSVGSADQEDKRSNSQGSTDNKKTDS